MHKIISKKSEIDDKYIVVVILLEYLVKNRKSLDYPFWYICIQRNTKNPEIYDIHIPFSGLYQHFENTFDETDKALAILGEDLLGNIIIESTCIEDKIIYDNIDGKSMLLKNCEYKLDPEILDEFCRGIPPHRIELI